LFELQQLITIFAYLSVMDKEKFYVVIDKSLKSFQFSILEMTEMIRDMIAILKEQEKDNDQDQKKNKDDEQLTTVTESADASYLETLIQWSAVLTNFNENH
jgi:hypothetical protein